MRVLNDERWEYINKLTNNMANICFQCGACTAQCPVNIFSDGMLNIRKLIRRAQIGDTLNDALWHCATCKLCENTCPRDVNIVDVVLGLRTLAFEQNTAPSKLEKVVWDIYENGNPWGGKKAERAKWAENMNIKHAKNGVQVLLYVGCEAAYNKRMHETIKAIVAILKAKNIDFGILGNEERCCGEPLKNAGEQGYLEELAMQNIQQFHATHAKTIITVSPHCSNMFKDVYKKYGLKPEVMHYSEYFYKLFKQGVIKIGGEIGTEITYHDPCILSRYDHIVSEPRELLLNVKGVNLKEMHYSGETSLCCGGGGNRMFMELQENTRLADVRAQQAKATGAKLLITACPYCNMNLYDSIKTNKIDLEIKELAEFLKNVIL